MRIFLSYPSEVYSRVEEVAIRLRGAGHRVFFAPEDLPTGNSFDVRIRLAIQQSDVFICFLTPEFIIAGRYTLSELEIAKKRWPSPAGHILPVRLRELPTEAIPPYLRAVTILDPKGNLAAEVVAALPGLKTRPKMKGPVMVVAVAVVLVSLFLWFAKSRSAYEPIIGKWKVNTTGAAESTFTVTVEATEGKRLIAHLQQGDSSPEALWNVKF